MIIGLNGRTSCSLPVSSMLDGEETMWLNWFVLASYASWYAAMFWLFFIAAALFGKDDMRSTSHLRTFHVPDSTV